MPPGRKGSVIRALLLGYAALAPLLSILLIGTDILLAILPLFTSHLLLLYATLVPNSQWWGPVMTRFQTTEREVWITIDDGPSLAHTLRLLDILEQFEAQATFFAIGEAAEKHPHLITEILMRGHTLGNHTFSHPSGTFWCAGPARIAREIDHSMEALRSSPERPVACFRTPAGLKNMFVHPALARRGITLIGWTVRGFDTVRRDPVRVAERIEKATTPGAIIVLHEDCHVGRDPDFSPRCLELVLQRLAARGYRFVIPDPEQLRA